MVLAAVGQLCSRASVSDNLRRCSHLISLAASRGAKVLFLPEASDFIAPSSEYGKLATSLDRSEFVKGLKEKAREKGLWVQVGVHESSPGPQRCYNTLLLISASGRIEQAYRKLHLFDIDFGKTTASNESKYIVRGEELLQPVESPVGKIGQLICYDIRFPEPGLILRNRGVNILTYPSAFTMRTGAAHWEVLLRARAIENQCYVFAAAQVGEHMQGRQSWGHSMIIDPWGTVLAQVPDRLPSTAPGAEEDDAWGTSLALAEVDLDWLDETRKRMPLHGQRRTDVYPELK